MVTSMTHTNKLDLIRQRCIEANPGIRQCKKYALGSVEAWDRPIRLADVLLAMPKDALDYSMGGVEDKQYVFQADRNPDDDLRIAYWNLREDDLSKQSEQTLTFLAELLS
jgi:hypothetical protein